MYKKASQKMYISKRGNLKLGALNIPATIICYFPYLYNNYFVSLEGTYYADSSSLFKYVSPYT